MAQRRARKTRLLLSVLAASGLGMTTARAEAPKPHRPILVELFTSQGCASCPQANVVLGELARNPDVLALTYAVGYWDYLGWKDTFARPEFASRQKDYARIFRRGLYTPQMVIDGADHASGLKAQHLHDLLAAAKMVGGVKLDARSASGKAQIVISGTPPALASEVWIAQYRPGPVVVDVKRGENAGAKVAHYNVVTALKRLGDWSGGEQHFESACAPACAVIVQETRGGRVIAAQGATLSGALTAPGERASIESGGAKLR
ncbi:MAG TPA: DUF1223 domain-containing protein [Caulobacterales bacterium]|nr:DUF1223 domain-containing protein [Caulobacterales bacterium]